MNNFSNMIPCYKSFDYNCKKYNHILNKNEKLNRKKEFDFGNKTICLNKQQSDVVHESMDKNILILACAGSGKTTTIMCRIKHLIDRGVDPESIVLTTFTRDATNDMKKKIETLFGYRLPVEVGTIDSISKKNIIKFGDGINHSTINVGEYSIKFLQFLKSHPNNTQYLGTKKYLFVDEFQDINDVQSDIISEFYKNGVSIIAVGDDAQNIYSFRGSNIEHIINFDKRYDNVSKHKLIVNYRSTPEIIKLANESIEKNSYQIPKKMVPYNRSINQVPTVTYYFSKKLQESYIRDKINHYISHGIPRHQIAVLSRTKSPLYALEEILTKNGISNVYLDGEGDVRSKIKDDHVCLSTVHKSKGLEWDVVFIINVNDNTFPSGKNAVELEEERRLFYVAVTRARNYLHMSYYKSFGSLYVSRFLSELPEATYDFTNYDLKYIGLTEETARDNKTDVGSLVRNLDGLDYMKLKDAGILPNFEFEKIQIYDQYKYLDFINDSDLHSDFAEFIKCFITRMIGETDKTSNGLYYESALLAIANIKLTQKEFNIYKNYDQNFTNNLEHVEALDLDYQIIRKLESDSNPIRKSDIATILDIVVRLFDNSKKFGVPFYKIPVFAERFLPENFEELMGLEFTKFTNKDNKWSSMAGCVWEIAKCNKIVNDGRRRLLYKDFDTDELNKYSDLYNDMYNNFVIRLPEHKKKCNQSIKSDDGVSGEISLLAEKTIIEIVPSNRSDIDASLVVQVLCHVHLCRSKNIPIKRIQIFNPLLGLVHTTKLDDWARGDDLIEYLLWKRQKVIDRTLIIRSIQTNNEQDMKIKKADYIMGSNKQTFDEIQVPTEYMFVD
jgi:hypothetical protein